MVYVPALTCPNSLLIDYPHSDQHLGELKGRVFRFLCFCNQLTDCGGPPGTILKFISDQHNDHGRAIEEAKRDLDVFKKAYMNLNGPSKRPKKDLRRKGFVSWTR